MEQNCNTICVRNSSKDELMVIVEYIHYDEILKPGSVFKVEAKAKKTAPLLNLFDIEYSENQVTVLLNTDLNFARGYDVNFYLDDEVVFSIVL